MEPPDVLVVHTVAAIGQRPGAGDIGADEVPLDQHVENPNIDAIAGIPGDNVAGARDVPPIVSPAAPPSAPTPSPTLARALLPVTSVPIKFPSIKLPDPASPNWTPPTPLEPPVLPEMTFRAAATVPPMVLSDPTSPGSAPILIPVTIVGHGNGAGRVGADQITLDDVGVGLDGDARETVSRDHVSSTSRGPADRRVARGDTRPRVGQRHAPLFVGHGDRARDVGTDVVALDEIRRRYNRHSSRRRCPR